MTALTKGPRQSLDWIEVPTGEWYYSHTKKEIYKYNKGVFEAYSASKLQTPAEFRLV